VFIFPLYTKYSENLNNISIVTDSVTYTNLRLSYFKYINLRLLLDCFILAPIILE